MRAREGGRGDEADRIKWGTRNSRKRELAEFKAEIGVDEDKSERIRGEVMQPEEKKMRVWKELTSSLFRPFVLMFLRGRAGCVCVCVCVRVLSRVSATLFNAFLILFSTAAGYLL